MGEWKQMREAPKTLGLYISVPFCRAKCSFCNFASGVGSAEAISLYIERLCHEMREARADAQRVGAVLPAIVDTVYFGGGTPSLLAPTQLQAIFEVVRGEFQVAAEAEITLEAAPGQIADPLFDAALGAGVNRVSLGVQSFVDREAQAVGRSHTEASCRAEFERLRRAGLTNVGVDLIAGLPYQTEASWERSIAVAADSPIQHISVYMLEVDDESRLGREVLGGGARLHAPAVPKDDVIAGMYELACARLPQLGFEQYEISNFACEGRHSVHNRRYWTRQPYLGFGLDAHSMLLGPDGNALRWANVETLEEYAGVSGCQAGEWVSEREVFEETVFLGLRMVGGLAERELAHYPQSWREEFASSAHLLEREGLMRYDAERWGLTLRGQMISSEVFGELLSRVPVAA